MAAYQNPKPLFKRLIKAAQRTAEHPHRSENNYFQLLLRTMAAAGRRPAGANRRRAGNR